MTLSFPGGRGWESWIVSPAQWAWTWTNSRRQWRAGKPGTLQFMGSQSDTTYQLNNNNNIKTLSFSKGKVPLPCLWLIPSQHSHHPGHPCFTPCVTWIFGHFSYECVHLPIPKLNKQRLLKLLSPSPLLLPITFSCLLLCTESTAHSSSLLPSSSPMSIANHAHLLILCCCSADLASATIWSWIAHFSRGYSSWFFLL